MLKDRAAIAVMSMMALAWAGAPAVHAQAATTNAPADSTRAVGRGPALTSTTPPGRQSWTSDRRDFQLGDIVTILVDEYTLTSLDKQVDATENRSHDLNFGISTSSGSNAFGVSTGNNSTSETRGLDARTNQLTTQMSARIVAISPNGLVRLEGAKALNVEQSKIHLSLNGWVRTKDISPDNFVSSSRMADAQLDYQAEGPLGTPHTGILGRILGKLWP